MRLTQIGYDIGLVSEERYERFKSKKEKIEKEIERLKKKIISQTERVKAYLTESNSSEIKGGISLYELLRRPEITYSSLKEIDEEMPDLDRETAEQVEIQIKYEGYIKRQLLQAEQFKKLENKKIPSGIEYANIKGISLEARQKLGEVKPANLGQASRISGVSPADVSVLMVYIEQLRREKRGEYSGQ